VVDSASAEIANAFLCAAKDLGITVRAPARVGNQDVPAIVEQFGNESGMAVVVWRCVTDAQLDAIRRAGYSVSQVNPDSYRAYERTMFVDTLNDWGWHGPEEDRPEWCDDAPWTL
jgi:hypothetical protein